MSLADRSAGPRDLASMSHPEYQHDQILSFDLVHDAVVAGANSPLAITTDEWGRRRWSRIGAEQFERCLYSSPPFWIELAQLTLYRGSAWGTLSRSRCAGADQWKAEAGGKVVESSYRAVAELQS